MSTFVVFGDHTASDKLVTATLNDYLDTHNEVTPDDDFVFVVAARHPVTDAIQNVLNWCSKNEVYYEIIASSDKVNPLDPIGTSAADYRVSANFMLEAVEDGYAYDKDSTVVLALVGEEDPSVDVTRAIARAIDSHMVVRDLSEGALTYIKFYGDAVDEPTTEENDMAEEAEEVTLEDLVTMAAEGDEDAQTALTEACEPYGIDPDEYATWEEVGELLEAALSAEEEEEPEEEEELAEPVDGWTADALKGLTLKEVREHAAAAGIANAKTAPRPELVKALIEGTAGAEEEEEAPAKPTKAAPKAKAAAPSGDIDIEALADAIIDRLIARLS